MTHLEQKSKHNTVRAGNRTTADSKEKKGKVATAAVAYNSDKLSDQPNMLRWWVERKTGCSCFMAGKVHGKLWELANKTEFLPSRVSEQTHMMMTAAMKMILTMMTKMTRMMTKMTRTFWWSTSSARMCPPECDIARFRWSRCPPSLSLLCCPLRFQPIRRWGGLLEP